MFSQCFLVIASLPPFQLYHIKPAFIHCPENFGSMKTIRQDVELHASMNLIEPHIFLRSFLKKYIRMR